MKVLDAEFVQGYIRMANDGWEQGWHERNGGNLTYRMKPEEVEMVKENWVPMLSRLYTTGTRKTPWRGRIRIWEDILS